MGLKGEGRYIKILAAIEAERKEEESYFKFLSSQKSNKEKVERGIMWASLVIHKKHFTVGEYVELEMERMKAIDKPHFFKSGVGCILKTEDGENREFRATVSYVKKNRIGIILAEDVISKYDISEKGKLSLELIYDERPYKVMKKTIEQVMKSKEPAIEDFREAISNPEYRQQVIPLTEKLFIDPHLNDSQKEALLQSVQHQRISVIHGPPGTGKTTTLVSLVRSLLQLEKRILICAPSNNAVDLLARKLDEGGIRTLRIGNVSRIGDHISHLTIAEKASTHADWQHIKSIKIEAQEAKRQAGKFKRKFGMQEKNNRNAMYQESRELKRWAREMEDKLMEKVVLDAQAVCSTLIGVRNRNLKDLKFDTVIIDEASQALEPECWTAMLMAKRVIFAGDHFQLPPTVKSSEAKELGLERTLLDCLSDSLDSSHLLKEQYRMNNQLLGFSNVQFYNGQLRSNSAVADRTLREGDEILSFIDTSGCGFDEEHNNENRSRKNSGEYFILREHMLQELSHYSGASIGIISPYSEQVRYVRAEIEEDADLKTLDIEVNSIDGFQGQEKDIIYLSLVRSNPDGEIGFLSDYRRLNVAITRARMKVVIIGDISTLSYHQLYIDLADHIEKHGTYKSAWEYMSL